MKNQNNNPNSNLNSRQLQDTKKTTKKLYKILKKPMSRRMAATCLGFTDQTYMVTQDIADWLKDGRAQIIGSIKCQRSKRFVERVTTNPDLFLKPNTNQLTMF